MFRTQIDNAELHTMLCRIRFGPTSFVESLRTAASPQVGLGGVQQRLYVAVVFARRAADGSRSRTGRRLRCDGREPSRRCCRS
ncbi:MAG: hypothetical protein KDA75_10205, partial [Planctomycetaceae bacterium]|nr:hypothetical protein [Planctomycetaceae bacterium]